MALSDAELEEIQGIIGRVPTEVERVVFDTMWSEHCSYKSSKPVLKGLPTKGSEVVLGVGEDSGIVFFTNHGGTNYCIAVSHESHNHPSQILPVEGAATGVGGVVRDVYCMGADVIGVLDSLHFGVPSASGDGMVSEIAKKVVHGVSDYGNALGVPVLGGETLYHESYNENCLVNVAALGLVEQDKIIRSRVPQEAKTEPYDVILFGKSTDMTGFGGASFSSAVLDQDDDVQNMGAVQVHDPFLKRVLVTAIQALLQRVSEQHIPIGFKDLGAGGISCAASELAVAGGFGVHLDLDKVNVAIPGLDAEVIACSETQERFCLVVPRYFSDEVLRLFNEEFELPALYHKAGASVIGEVISEQRFIIDHNAQRVCDLPVEAITTEVLAERFATTREIRRDENGDADLAKSADVAALAQKILSGLNNASKRYVYRYYDNAVKGNTVLYPGEGDAVVVTPVEGCSVGLAVSMDSNLYGIDDPYVSGAAAVAESIRNVIAVGARPMAVTDCLNYGNPEQGSVFFDFKEGVRGISDAANALSFIEDEPVPIISGNVSLYNESKTGNAVVPSPVVCALGRVEEIDTVRGMQVKEAGLSLLLVGRRYAEFAGTEYARLLGLSATVAPQLRLDDEAKQNQFVYEAIRSGQVSASHDISSGGLWQTLSEMHLGERARAKVGLRIQLPENEDVVTLLFSENGGYVVAVSAEAVSELRQKAESMGVWVLEIGHSVSELGLSVQQGVDGLFSFGSEDCAALWNSQNQSGFATAV